MKENDKPLFHTIAYAKGYRYQKTARDEIKRLREEGYNYLYKREKSWCLHLAKEVVLIILSMLPKNKISYDPYDDSYGNEIDLEKIDWMNGKIVKRMSKGKEYYAYLTEPVFKRSSINAGK